MKSLYFASALSLAALPAMAQSPQTTAPDATKEPAKVGVPTTDQDTHALLLNILHELTQIRTIQLQQLTAKQP